MSVGRLDYEPNKELKLSAITGKEYIDAIMDQSESESDSDNNSDDEI
jgi:hypothetical protein